MACERKYIRSVIKDESEAKRLEELHAQIGEDAKATKAFRKEGDNLVTSVSSIDKINKARAFIRDTNLKYGKTIARLAKIALNKEKLVVDVLPLSKTGTQANLVFEKENEKFSDLEFNQKLLDFFSNFGIRFDYSDKSGVDLLRKIAYINPKTESEDFINNSTKLIAQLLQASPIVDFQHLLSLVENTKEFKEEIKNSSVKDTWKYLQEGNRIPMEEWMLYIKEYNKVKNLVLEKYIKESLVDFKNNKSELHKYIDKFLQWFKDLFTNTDNLKEVTDGLISQVLFNNSEIILGAKNSPENIRKEQVTLEKALNETKHGEDIINTLGKEGLILTGSVSVSEQGTVFRKLGYLLHDIDWLVPYEYEGNSPEKVIKDKFEGTVLVREFDSPTYYTKTFIVPPIGTKVVNLTFFKPEVYGKTKWISSYDVVNSKGEIVSNYRRYYDVKANNKVVQREEVYNEGLIGVPKDMNALSVDLFFNKQPSVFQPYEVQLKNGTKLKLANWLSSFTEKLKYGRMKDLVDWARFIPNNFKQTSISTSVFQLPENQVNYVLKSANALQSDKVRNPKNNLQGFYNDLQKQGVPNQQIEIIKSLNPEGKTKEELLTELLANYSYTVEINTAKNQSIDLRNSDFARSTGLFDEEELAPSEDAGNSQYYSDLTVPGGTNYTENEISTPLITPSIKGHAQFSTDNGIGWFRSDDKTDDTFTGEEYDNEDFSIDPITGESITKPVKTKITSDRKTTKTRRILELQSDYFQNLRKNFVNYGGIEQFKDDFQYTQGKDLEGNDTFYKKPIGVNSNFGGEYITKEEYEKAFQKHLNTEVPILYKLLFNDNNWVTFFVKSIIQDSAKKGYEKVLFPTGNTASKVEGHTTLEEFKKEKENRLQRLYEDLEEDKKGLENYTKKTDEKLKEWNKNRANEDVSNQYRLIEAEKAGLKKDIERTELEINAVKLVLQRIETEGFGALRPIYNFYENQVKNILKKNYNVKEITDEYGNTWNEIEISELEVRKAILLQKEDSNQQKPIKELNDRLTILLNKLGWSVTSLSAYKKWYKDEYNVEEDSPEFIRGLADLTNKLIAISEGKESMTTLPEEASHAILFGMMDSPLYKKLAELVVNEPIYKEVFKQYINVYKGDINKVKFEALGKLLRDSFIKQYPNVPLQNKTILTGLKRLIEKFLNLFRKDKSLTEEIDYLAKQILSGDISMVDSNKIGDGKFFEIDSEKYKSSNELDHLKSKLDDVIKKRVTRLKIYENKGVGDYSKEEKERVNKLHKLYINDKITLGVVEFINDIDKDAEATWKRLNKVIKEDDTIGTAKILRELGSYIIPFNKTLKGIKAELNGLDHEKYKEISDEISKITSKIDDLEVLYNNKAKLLLSNYLFPFAENNEDIKSPEDLVKKLSQEKDISITSRFLDSMAETTDDILGLFDRAVKEAKEKARISAFNKQREILALDKQLKDAGISNDFIYEKDKNGKITRNYVTEFNQHEYKLARVAAYNSIKSKLKDQFNVELSDNEVERLEQFSKHKGLQKAYNTLWRNWIKDNTQPNPKAKELIEQKKQYFQDIYGEDRYKGNLRWEVAFTTWLNDNVVNNVDPYTGDVNTYYKGELMLPANKYKNKQYSDIQADKLKAKYYNKIIQLKNDSDKFLPSSMVTSYLAPQIRKDWLERAKNDPKSVLKEAKEDLKLRETDTEFGDLRKLTDIDNKPVNFLPIHYTSRIDNADDLSLDATASIIKYIEMAEDYKEMNKIIDVLELGEEVLAKREVVVGESVLNKTFNKLGLTSSKATEQLTGGKAYERYKDFMDMVVFGKMKANENWLDIAQFNTVKIIDGFNKLTSVAGLAANVYGAVNNTLLGNALVRQEAFAKEFIGKGGLTFADKTYWAELPGFLNSIGNPYSDNKLKLVGELMDVMQDFKEKSYNINTDRSRLGKLVNSDALFFLHNSGEHQIQWRTALAVMENKKIKTVSGQEINLWEAFEINDGKAELRNGLVDFTMDDVIATGLRIKALNQKLHGIYTDSDRSAIQKWALGRMALVFRKWIKSNLNRRFDPKRYDYSLDKHVEGMYVTTFSFLNKVRKDLKSYQVIWNQLDDRQKANVKRSALEFSYMIITATLAAILTNLAEDDDDNWALNFTAYQANRMYTDLSFFINPKSMIQIVKSPMAGIRTLQLTLNLFDLGNTINLNPMNDEDMFSIKRYKSGPHKGEAKGYVTAKKLVPVIGNIERLITPEEQLKFFTRPTFGE